MRTLLIAVACVSVVLSWSSSFAYEVPREHPRIFIRKSDLPLLAKRCGPGGPFAAEYQAMKTAVDEYIDTDNKGTLGHWLPEIPLVYVVEKSLGHDARKYADFFRKRVWGTDGRGAGTPDAGEPDKKKRRFPGGMSGNGNWYAWDALVYDWMYDAFTPEERKVYAEVLGPWLCNRGWMRGPSKSPEITLDPGIDNYWYNQTWGGCGSYIFGNYYTRAGVGPKTLVALAIYGEETRYDRHAKVYLDSFERVMKKGFLPALNARGGVPTEGPYHGSGMIQSAALGLEAYSSATGDDLFGLLGRHALLAETPLWYAFSSMPHNNAMGYIDDASPGMNRGLGDAMRIMPLIARRCRQPVAQHYALKHFNTRPKVRSALGSYRRDAWADILWLNPKEKATAPNRLPLAYHFPGTGHVYMRSAWDDPDATWAFFGAGARVVSAWGSDDEGSFQIFKGGPLATNKSRGASILHNIVLVYDPNEPRRKGPNDGGLRDWYLEKGAGTKMQAAGQIVAFEHRPEYTYACADLTKAYYPDKVSACHRSFLYLRSQPECFVVYDRVQAAKAEFPKTWQMYVTNKPRLLGGNSVFVSSYDPENNLKKYSNARNRYLSSGFGTMMVRVLLPEDVRIVLRGEDHSRNPHAPAPARADAPKPKRPPRRPTMRYAQWRIEEEPAGSREVDEFLNVLIPRLVPEAEAGKAVTGDTLVFPTAEIVDKNPERIRLRITSADRMWEVEVPRSTKAVGSVKRLSPDGKRTEFTGKLTSKVEPNGEIPGYTRKPEDGQH